MNWLPILSMIGNMVLKNNDSAKKVINSAASIISSTASEAGYNPTDKNQERISEMIKRSGI